MNYGIFGDSKPIEYVYGAVYDAMYDLNPHCEYELAELVELGHPGLWCTLMQYSNVRQLGKEFFEAVNRGKFPGLRSYTRKTSDRHHLYKLDD